jgi:hypothetical protein
MWGVIAILWTWLFEEKGIVPSLDNLKSPVPILVISFKLSQSFWSIY